MKNRETRRKRMTTIKEPLRLEDFLPCWLGGGKEDNIVVTDRRQVRHKEQGQKAEGWHTRQTHSYRRQIEVEVEKKTMESEGSRREENSKQKEEKENEERYKPRLRHTLRYPV
jgi:hypothetical protein